MNRSQWNSIRLPDPGVDTVIGVDIDLDSQFQRGRRLGGPEWIWGQAGVGGRWAILHWQEEGECYKNWEFLTTTGVF